MQFGDIISNGWAGDRNPLKLTMYMRTTGTFIEGLCLRGEVVKHYKKDHRCQVVLAHDTPDLLARWKAMAAKLLADYEASKTAASP